MIEIGACPINCNNSLIPYLALVFLITMITCCAQTPAIFITLRSVKEDERPIAMGMQYLLLRLLAYIPVRFLLYLQNIFNYFCRHPFTSVVPLTRPASFWTGRLTRATREVAPVPSTRPQSFVTFILASPPRLKFYRFVAISTSCAFSTQKRIVIVMQHAHKNAVFDRQSHCDEIDFLPFFTYTTHTFTSHFYTLTLLLNGQQRNTMKLMKANVFNAGSSEIKFSTQT